MKRRRGKKRKKPRVCGRTVTGSADSEVGFDLFHYPWFIWLGGVLTMILFGYSLYHLVPYYRAIKVLQLGEKHSHAQEFDQAIECYKKVLDSFPASKRARKLAAKAYFLNGNARDDEIGFAYLEGIYLADEEIEGLKKVAPPELKKYFRSRKKEREE